MCGGSAEIQMEQLDPGLEILDLWGAADVTQRKRWM